MSELKIRTRNTGALAVMPPGDLPTVTTPTGGTVDVVTQVSAPGFNPLDLLYASLAACMVLSARIAATRLGVADRLGEVRADVGGEKAKDEPSRLETFNIKLEITGDLDAAMKERILADAENICTVSNTLRGAPT
ncbi:MAG: OsmC family protein, partial [Mesorhizobium sp.]